MIDRSERSGLGSAVAPALGTALLIVGLFFVLDALVWQDVFTSVQAPIAIALIATCTIGLGLFRSSRFAVWFARSVLVFVVALSSLSLASVLGTQGTPSIGLDLWEQWFARTDLWLLVASVTLLAGSAAPSTLVVGWSSFVVVLSSVAGSVFVAAHGNPSSVALVVPAVVGPFVAGVCAIAAARLGQGGAFISTVGWLPLLPAALAIGLGLAPVESRLVVVLASVLTVAAGAVAIGSVVQSRQRNALAKLETAQTQEREAHALTESATGLGTWALDERAGEIVLSPEAARILGETERTAIAKLLNGEVAAWIDQAARSNSVNHLTIAADREGKRRWFAFVASRIPTELGEELRGTVRDATTEQEAVDAIGDRLTLLERVAEKVPDVDFIYDVRNHEYIYSNHPIGDLVGRLNDSTGSVIEDSVHEQDRDLLLAHTQRINRAKDDSAHEVEFRVRHSDGRVLWLRSHASVFEKGEDGNPVTVFGTYQDVTERHELTRKLQEIEARFERVSAKCPGVIYQFSMSPNGAVSFPYVSQSAFDLFGVTREAMEANAESAFALVHEEDLPQLMALIEESRRTLADLAWVGRIVRPDQRTVWVQAASRPTVLEDGTTTWDGVAIDVTAIRLAQMELEETQKWFDALLAESSTVAYVCDPKSPFDLTQVTPNVRFILGFIPDQLVGRPLFGTAFIHPDDVEEFRAHERRFVDHGRSKCEYRMRSLSGDYVWLRDDVRIVSGDMGDVEVVGAWTEVTDVHRALTLAGESDARFLRLASQIPAMVVELVLHADGTPEFKFVSHGSYALTGVTPEDIKARPELFLKLIDADSKPALYRELVRSQQEFSDAAWEGRVRLESGEEKTIKFAGRPSADNGSVKWTGSFWEVSITKRVEREPEQKTPDGLLPQPNRELQISPSQTHTHERPSEVLVILDETNAERLLESGKEAVESGAYKIVTLGGLGLELAKRRLPSAVVVVDGLPDASAETILEAMRGDDDLSSIPVLVFEKGLTESKRRRLYRSGAALVSEAEPTAQELETALRTAIKRPE